MNSRHAAAFALMGWYLMVPQRDARGDRVVPDPDAPLSKWYMFSVGANLSVGFGPVEAVCLFGVQVMPRIRALGN
jgi:hypothetical protein